MTQAVLQMQSTTDQKTLHMAMELSSKTWLLAFSDGSVKQRKTAVPAGDQEQLLKAVGLAKKRFELPADAPIVSCFEAGRDGFWIDRMLATHGVRNVVVEPASVPVDRRKRRAKTDRLDVEKLLQQLIRATRGEPGVWRVVRVPTEESEAARRLHRERSALVKERTRHVNRIRSLFNLEGIRLGGSVVNMTPEHVRTVRRWDQKPLPAALQTEIVRELERAALVATQINHLDEEIGTRKRTKKARVEAAEKARLVETKTVSRNREMIEKLARLKGVGMLSANVLVTEFFGWREFKNRREIGALAGLTGVPNCSGDMVREQGISKAGNRRVRTTAVELAWCWVRWQPTSTLTSWFNARSGPKAPKRSRRVSIVAVARRLLVDMWHYLEHDRVPEGAILNAA